MHTKEQFKIISFYEFINLNGLDQLKLEILSFLKQRSIKGTILLANEGVNGMLSCKKSDYKTLIEFIENLLNKNISFKINDSNAHAFLRLKVKIKKEIIKLEQKNISPLLKTGEYVHPDKWDELISKKDVVIIDTRNFYESDIGTFYGSVLVNSKNFRDFSSWVKNNKEKILKKKIAMFCTGGVRCEKASSYLISKGFKDVFQLHGGIISYFQKTKNKNKRWIGECFVFDERVSVKDDLSKGSYVQCYACRSPVSHIEKKSKYFKQGVYCPKCFKITSKKQKNGFEERKKQIEIAKKNGAKHLGS